MEIDTEIDNGAPSKRRGMFDWTINLGHVFIVLSLFLSAAGLYAHDEARLATLDTKIGYLESQNLPPRVSALEAQTNDLHESLKDIRNILSDIRTSLDRKADKRN